MVVYQYKTSLFPRLHSDGVLYSAVALVIACVVPDTLSIAQSPCARVTIQISQQAVLTRSAFDATLTVDNTLDQALTGFGVTIEIKDSSGNLANERFGILAPSLSGGLTGVDGRGTLGSNQRGSAMWLILPADEAAPQNQSEFYTIGGRVFHFQGGVLVSVPLFPVRVEVFPNPKLFFRYYLQSPVYSDNPFTPDVVEPAEPFALALLVLNDGFGLARDLRVRSAQPRIVESSRGLLVDFRIIEAQVGNDAAIPCLTARLGDIPGKSSQTACWKLVSSLQGRFIDYSATFEHVNAFGDRDLSLLESVEVFELDHVVQLYARDADGVAFDALPDFLIRDNPPGEVASDELPSLVHSSDGRVLALGRIPGIAGSSVRADGRPSPDDFEVTLAVVVPPPLTDPAPVWHYVRLADPGQGRFELAQVERIGADKTRQPVRVARPGGVGNAWSTHRYLPFDGPPAREEHLVHLFDRFDEPGTYSYSLTYAPVPGGGLEIVSSTSPERSAPALLDGRSVAGEIYAFLSLPADAGPIARVLFFLDDSEREESPLRADRAAPYDVAGDDGALALPLDTSRLEPGMHTLTALVERLTGSDDVVEATFSVVAGFAFRPRFVRLQLPEGGAGRASSVLAASGDQHLEFTLESGETWLGAVPAKATTPTEVALDVNAADLPRGRTTAHITARSKSSGLVAADLEVAVDVTPPPPPPFLGFGRATLSFSVPAGLRDSAQTTLAASTGTAAAFALGSDQPSWLTAAPAKGSTPVLTTVSVAADALAPGVYQGQVTATAAGFEAAVLPVELRVGDASVPALSFNPSRLTALIEPGEIAVLETSLAAAGGDADFQLTSNVPWLGVVPLSGRTAQSIRLTVDGAQLAPGRHEATVFAMASGFASTRLEVTADVGCAAITALACSPDAASDAVELVWQSPIAYADGVNVFRDGLLLVTLAGAADHYTDRVPPGTYSYAVEGVCAGGVASLRAACDATSAACLPIRTLRCTSAPVADRVELAWASTQPYAGGVRVHRDGALVATLAGTANIYFDRPGAGEHSYSVEGDCGGGVLGGSASCSVVHIPCLPIESFACEATPADDVRLTWTLVQPFPDGIRVLRGGAEIAVLPGNATEYLDHPGPGRHTYAVEGICSGVRAASDECTAVVDDRPAFRRGYVNIDARFDISDAIALLGYLFLGNPRTLPCLAAADTDANGRLEITDAVIILQYLFLGGRAPREPFSACGPDPLPSGLTCESAPGCP